ARRSPAPTPRGVGPTAVSRSATAFASAVQVRTDFLEPHVPQLADREIERRLLLDVDESTRSLRVVEEQGSLDDPAILEQQRDAFGRARGHQEVVQRLLVESAERSGAGSSGHGILLVGVDGGPGGTAVISLGRVARQRAAPV